MIKNIKTKGNKNIRSNQHNLHGSKFLISDKYKLPIVPIKDNMKQKNKVFFKFKLNLLCSEFWIMLSGFKIFIIVTTENKEIYIRLKIASI